MGLSNDNDPEHTSGLSQKWLEGSKISVLTFTGQSFVPKFYVKDIKGTISNMNIDNKRDIRAGTQTALRSIPVIRYGTLVS